MIEPQRYHTHKWEPITDLPDDWQTSLDNRQTHAMVQAWHEQSGELREKDLYKEFLRKLQRQWSIETGIIEGIYSLSDGATKTLIEKGLDAALIGYSDTDDDPETVIATIKDHEHAITGLYSFVSGQRSLGTSYIKELHRVLTEHQDTYIARDTLGNEVIRDLPRGTWKKHSNSVEHPDGTSFEYCPPEHVDQEMDNLIEMHLRHCKENVPADIESAWLHHRFSVIHPFTDGNGRVSRCLATLVLLRENWLPLVVTRTDRSKYIDALRAGDADDLRPLVDLIGALQRKAIREAFSLSEHVIHESIEISRILSSAKAKFEERKKAEEDLRNRASLTADSLQNLAFQQLQDLAQQILKVIANQGANFDAWGTEGKRNTDKAKYYYHQIVSCARELNYYANMQAYQSWASLIVQTDRRIEILFAFHGIGHHASGVLGCTAMLFTKDVDENGQTTIGDVVPLCDEPFEFTYTEDSVDVQRTFSQWLEKATIMGISEWQNLI